MGGVYRIQTFFGFLYFFYIYKAPKPSASLSNFTLTFAHGVGLLSKSIPDKDSRLLCRPNTHDVNVLLMCYGCIAMREPNCTTISLM